jgi:hypothetical protein
MYAIVAVSVNFVYSSEDWRYVYIPCLIKAYHIFSLLEYV